MSRKAMKLLTVTGRAKWRAWLEKHHDTDSEIWLVYYRKASGKQRISYGDAVEEALCFGWIDSIQKGVDHERLAQRFTPRKRIGDLSEINRQRVQHLFREGKMTPAGMAVIGDALEVKPLVLTADVKEALRKDRATWRHFKAFPESYRRVRVAYVESARGRPEEFVKRLGHLVEMTAKNKRFGWVEDFR
jgi:uncharacterized protein YdeI (YjbR/CyaY-like superfamily)